ncbi:aldehyde dehydrogenase family protein [Streptomyces sp. AV19]|uniref:aldehyde dehydrogenase family protein n=1 Tax=Streptomyces sp. AV19 TaxID=2793068 RepID=UPI0018FE80FB|nr:aldehyde dehydrogenase [Streptomyces sp. AV19]MBH1933791.1 aldehyde dehydrogenase family protein [Streptomyces sp. AV19]MDG4535704.1 aldehyde dehydrogenase [Streptomyces sp. AV19]
MLSYGAYAAGRDRPGTNWVYTVRSSALLSDFFGSLALKRGLENGRISPSDAPEQVVGRVSIADQHDVEAALAAAASAARQWRKEPLKTRMRMVEEFRTLVLEKFEDIIDLMATEGHPRALARWEMTGLLANTGPQTRTWLESQMETTHIVGPRRMTIRRVADGVVCLNPPQNATVANSMLGVWALAAGNSLVVRAPVSAPLGVLHALHELVVPALERVGAPVGLLNIVCSDARKTLDHWLASPLVNDIMYFGASGKGIAFGAECVARGKKPVLELAGNDTVVVWHDADLDYAAEALAESFYGSGQVCMAPNRAVVHPRIADQLLDRLRLIAREIRPGYPEDPGVLLSPVLRPESYVSVLEQALAGGAELVCGGRRIDVDGRVDDIGLFLEPTVLRVHGLKGATDLDAVRYETFFPLLPVVVPEEAPDDELLSAVIDFVEKNAYGLRNSLWTRDKSVMDRFVTEVGNAGLLKVNDSHIGFLSLLPSHGGNGLTGGPGGEANYPMLRTSRLQGVSITDGIRPREAAFDALTEVETAQ